MVAKNDITGDAIQSRTNNRAYEDGWDRIFGKKKAKDAQPQITDPDDQDIDPEDPDKG